MFRLTPPLACPVRACHLPLHLEGRTWTCPNRHTFDVARSGYVNLLQPQDRKSPDAGDTAVAVEARRRLLAAGIGRAVVDTVVTLALPHLPDAEAVVADLGCGAGDALAVLQTQRPIAGVGIDLSAAAINIASKHCPTITWVVANADRRLPLLDGSVTLVWSLHARRNPAECHRVLAAGGHLIVAVPAPDDLIELRHAVQGRGIERDRVADLLTDHDATFDVVERSTVRERHVLAGDRLRDVLRGTYRGERASAATRVEALDSLEVTFASDLVLLRRR
jgi:23S rRNA (guanine745-N1)-methyltransferase